MKPSRFRPSTFARIDDVAARSVALCPQGLPVEVLKKIGTFSATACEECEGPTGHRWLYLPVSKRRSVLSQLGVTRRRELHRELFQSWEPDGWGYLRRACHAIEACDYQLLMAQHLPYTLAIAPIGRDYLYQHFLAVAKGVSKKKLRGADALSVLVGAGRLALTTWRGGGFRAAVRHFHRALPLCTNPVDKAAVLYELANCYALQKDGAALTQARCLYDRAYVVLDQISDLVDRTRTEIRLANGLALVEYHEQRNSAALALEEHAQSLAESIASDHPETAKWARMLLNVNTAKLVEKRFGDTKAAIKLLESIADQCDSASREARITDMARMSFDLGDYNRVIDLLSGICEGGQFVTPDDRKELFARFMFAISLVAIGELSRAHRQLARIAHLCYVLD